MIVSAEIYVNSNFKNFIKPLVPRDKTACLLFVAWCRIGAASFLSADEIYGQNPD
jgi:hypothetical protein